jgi:hypothetical protein
LGAALPLTAVTVNAAADERRHPYRDLYSRDGVAVLETLPGLVLGLEVLDAKRRLHADPLRS